MPHNARRPPAVRHPVSSRCTARLVRSRSKRSSQGSTSASATRARIASIVPLLNANARAEQLLAELDDVTTRDPVSDRQRRDRRLQARAEHTAHNLLWQLGAPTPAAARAAHALAAMLDQPDRDRRQLLDLVAHRLAHRDPLALAEHMPALAT